ncbi:MAG: EscU/YscU/HrcU family type III secretion system export apparatus switch protein [Candidatus Wallbacteria bacterium]
MNLNSKKDEKKIAVALKYNQDNDTAPKISAKGRGVIAERILSLAEKNNIPFYKDGDLCELLLKIDSDSEIPVELYAAVAKVMAFIYRANKNFNLK